MKSLQELIRPVPRPAHAVCVRIKALRAAIDRHFEDFGVDYAPDFQRGHVWTQQQRERFVEGLIRGAIPSQSIILKFNSAHESNLDGYAGDLPRSAQIVDGLQRFTALDLFMRGEVLAFGKTAQELVGTPFSIGEEQVTIHTYRFGRKADLLGFYLDMNTGGTPHSAEEIARVSAMRDAVLL